MTPSELTRRARIILGPRPLTPPPSYMEQVSLATVAAWSAGSGNWPDAVERLQRAAAVAADHGDPRFEQWSALAREAQAALAQRSIMR